jgi:transcription-repair coupling factor (superfamily II helicase)
MTGENDRIRFYQKIASADDENDLDDIEKEIKDRFGPLPEELLDLLYIARLKTIAGGAGAESISGNKKQVSIRFYRDIGRGIALQAFYEKYEDFLEMGNRQIRIDIDDADNGWKTILLELVLLLKKTRGAGAVKP